MKKAIVLIAAFWGLHAYADQGAPVQTIVCSQGDVNLVMQIEGGDTWYWIDEAQLYNAVSGDCLGSVDRNDITISPGEAYIRTDVEYNATGSFTNCHQL